MKKTRNITLSIAFVILLLVMIFFSEKNKIHSTLAEPPAIQQTQTDDIIAEMSSVPWEELKASAAEYNAVSWTGVALLAELPEEEIALYGYRNDSSNFRGVILEIQGKPYYRDMYYMTVRQQLPEIYWDSNTNCLLILCLLNTGTGFNAETLFVEQLTEHGLVSKGCFDYPDYTNLLQDRIEYRVEGNFLTLIDTTYEKELFSADISEYLDSAEKATGVRDITLVALGDQADFQLEEELILSITPGCYAGSGTMVSYEESPNIYAKVTYHPEAVSSEDRFTLGEFFVEE